MGKIYCMRFFFLSGIVALFCMPVKHLQGIIMLKTASENFNQVISYSDVLAVTIIFPARITSLEKSMI